MQTSDISIHSQAPGRSAAELVATGDYRIIRRNGAVVPFAPSKIAVAMTKAFLAVNGIQTLSQSTATAAHQVEALREAGVSALRLSPQSRGFAETVALYHQRLAGETGAGELASALRVWVPGGALSDGFLTGPAGASWSGA